MALAIPTLVALTAASVGVYLPNLYDAHGWGLRIELVAHDGSGLKLLIGNNSLRIIGKRKFP